MSAPDLFTSVPDSDKEELARNPRLRRYAQAVDKVLVSFDSIVEWPDIVTFLSKLGKTVQGHPEFPTIPAKFTIAKRLAQCLNPNLPAGVHQKALETFVIIFEAIGPGNLARDSHIWLYGLFPYFANAPMSVKPLLLSLVDTHLLPLHVQLHPILRSLLMALLPGLEEEDNEHFDAHLALMDRLQQQVEVDQFFSTLWSIVASTPQTRRTALVYLYRRVATLRGSPEQITIALATCFVDKNLLVQRLALDLLVARFPIHRIKAQFGRDEVVDLTGEALKVVLRRDMSLNRRLHVWLLGDDDHYFQQIVRPALASTLVFYISKPEPSSLVRTVKVMISLLDKEEIAISMLQDTLSHVLQAFWAYSQSHQSNAPDDDDVHATCRMFLDMLDPIHVWRELVTLIEREGAQACPQLDFLIANVPLGDEEEVFRLHLPLASIRLLQFITSVPDASLQSVRSIVALLSKLLTQASFNRAATVPGSSCPDSAAIAEFYTGRQALEVNHIPLAWLVSLAEELIYSLIASRPSSGSTDAADILRECVHLVSSLGGQPGSPDKLVSRIFACSAIELLVPLIEFALLLPSEDLESCAPRLLRHVFDCFRPRGDVYDIETVQLYWLLLDRFPPCFRHFIGMLNEAVAATDGYDAFGVVWKHSQNRPTLYSALCEPLLTILQSLQLPCLRIHAERWVRNYLSSYTDVLQLVCNLLSDPLTFREPMSSPIDVEMFAYHGAVDLSLMDFAFRTLLTVSNLAGSQLVDALSKPAKLDDATTPFGDLIVTACCNVLETFHEPDKEGNGALHSSACDCLIRVLESTCPISRSLLIRTQDSLCTSLRMAQLYAQHDLQSKLLVAVLVLFRGHGAVQSSIRRGTLLGSNFALALLDVGRPSSPSVSTTRTLSPPPSQVPVPLQLALQTALCSQTCRPVLDHYVECCMLLVDQLGTFVAALHTTFIDQLRKSIFDDRDEMATLAFLRALHFLFSRAFRTRDEDPSPQSDGPRTTTNLPESSGGLSSISTYVTGVFSPTASVSQSGLVTPSHWLLPLVVGKLPDIVALMLDLEQEHATSQSFTKLLSRTALRLQRLATLAIRCRQGDWVDACIIQAGKHSATTEWMTLQVKVSQLDLAAFLTSAMTSVLRRVTNGPKDNILLPVPPTSSLPIIAALVSKCNVDFASTWPQVQLFLRDYLNLHPNSVAPEVVVVASKYAEELVEADRKVAKDAIDTFLRMLDSLNATLVSFVFQADDSQRRDAPSDSSVTAATKDVTDALLTVCKQVAIPSVRKVIKDADRAGAVFSNIVHYLVQPIFRQVQHPSYNAVLQLMQEIAKIPSSARTWRREVWDHFMDHRFFPVPLISFPSWADLLRRYAHEADRINEVLNRIAPASSGTLFGSREQEIMTRCQLVRRISVLLWCGDRDRHIAAVPVLQEKVMDLFGLQHSDMNYELFLLARVLILRFSDMHLTNMWAILVGEMMQILDLHSPDGAASNDVNPSRDAVVSVTAVCKLLDLVTTMQHSDFQIYLPVFVGDGPSMGLLGGVCSWDEARHSTSNLDLDVGERRQRARQLDLLLGDNIGPSQAELGRFAVNLINRSRRIGFHRASYAAPDLSVGVVPDLVSSLQHK